MRHNKFWPLAATALYLSMPGYGQSSRPAQSAGVAEQKFTAKSKKTEAEEKRVILLQLEDVAQKDAIAQALTQVYGTKAKIGDKYDLILDDAIKRRSTFVKNVEIVQSGVLADTAKVEVLVTYDKAKLEAYLKDSYNLSAAGDVINKLSIYVLAYTVEGQDPNRSQPQLLREEIVDDKKNVQSSSSSSDIKNVQAAASTSQSSVDAAYRAESSTAVGVVTSRAVGIAASSSETNAAISATQQASAASFTDQRSKFTNANFSDTSSSFRSLRVYADTTKKGAGQTDEIKTKLSELLGLAGFTTREAAVNLQSREFNNSDELTNVVLDELRKNPNIDSKDFVALALNRFTPTEANGFTSVIQYKIVRVGDGLELLPQRLLDGVSGKQPSEDLARKVAVEIAMTKGQDAFSSSLKKAINDFQVRETARASVYEIRIANTTNPVATRPLQEALRAAGFEIKQTLRNGVQTITVELGGKNSKILEDILEPFYAAYDDINIDDGKLSMRAK